MKKLLFALAIIFNIGFPKGDVVLSGIPITWGYLLVGVASIYLFLVNFFGRVNFAFTTHSALILFALMGFDCIVVISALFNGFESVGYFVSLLIGFFYFPIVLLYFGGVHVLSSEADLYKKLFVHLLRFVVIFGLINFFLKYTGYEIIDFQGLTSSFGGELSFEDKYNDRGGIFKLASTYANGNIYAVCMLMLLPIYISFERNLFFIGAYKLSVVLTLSRTAWFGLLIFELLNFLINRRPSVYSLFKLVVYFLILILGIYILITLMGLDLTFVFDSNLGGRSEQLEILSSYRWFPNLSFSGIEEMVYFSVLKQFGVFALLFLIIIFFIPVSVGYRKIKIGNAGVKPYVISAVIFPLLCLSDGAVQFIPVMLLYWMVVSMILKYE